MEMIEIKSIKNGSSGIGQPCQAWNRLRPEGYGIEVTPVCPRTGRNFDNRGIEVTPVCPRTGRNFDNR
jgi:hypothetical protein